MASPSSSFASSSALPSRNYDVFLSFRGADTRDNFTSHLLEALRRRGIDAFIDEQLRRGSDLQRLLDIIRSSKISLIIFSKNYADSDWCLEELATILECRRNNNQVVVPIFYKVRKGDVANQTGSFETPFKEPENTFKKEFVYRVPTWKAALRVASNIRGYVFPNDQSESQLVQQVANEVLKTLSDIFPGETTHLVGIESRRKTLEEMLCFGEDKEVHVVAVLGMPGIGKKAIANDIYFQHRRNFDSGTIIPVKPEEKSCVLEKKIICDVFELQNVNDAALKSYERCLSNMKVLIVLEDVSSEQQVKFLIKSPKPYRGGSRIIITTRDKKSVKNVVKADKIYEVPALNGREALKLFCRHAFPGESKPPEKFMNLTNMILDYAKGLPLALEVLGSSLKEIEEVSLWEYKLGNLESWLDEETQKLLKISYDALNYEQKEAFLDIACFFRSENADYVTSLLDSSGRTNVIEELVDKRLITIAADRRVWMHDLLCIMGKEISLEASRKEPGKRSRLWDHEDICHVLKHKTGSKHVRGIFLDTSKVRKRDLSNIAFDGMCNLIYLKIHDSRCSRGCEVDHKPFDGELSFLSDKLRYLHWQGYPFKDFPSKFEPKNLVDLKLQFSEIEALWEDNKVAPKLKWIDLSHSRHLSVLSGLSEAENLERLNLQGCTRLVVLPSSIKCMQNLVHLNLRECTSLTDLPDNIDLKSLKTVILSGCSKLETFTQISENIESLHLDGTGIKVVPDFILKFSKLAILNLKLCKKLTGLPEGLSNLKSLQELVLSGCSSLTKFPEICKDMRCLEILLLDETGVEDLPKVMRLINLKKISLSGTVGGGSRSLLGPLLKFSCLTDLHLANANLDTFPENVSFLSSLQCLILSRNGFETLPASIVHLHHLKCLYLEYCKNLQSLPELPSNLEYLDAHGCESLESVESPLMRLMMVERIHSMYVFTNCFKLGQKAPEQIFNHVQTKSKLMANASTKHYNQSIILEPLVGTSYPGTDVPSWFSYQRTGSWMEAQLPPHWCGSKFVGIALCAVVSFEGYNNSSNHFSVECTCEFKNEDGDCISFSCTLGGWRLAETGGQGEGSRRLEQDHVFLGFNSCFRIVKCREKSRVDRCGHTVATLKFDVTDDTPNKPENCKVEKCGMSLFYAPDEEASRQRGTQARALDLRAETNQVARNSTMNPVSNRALNHTDITRYSGRNRNVCLAVYLSLKLKDKTNKFFPSMSAPPTTNFAGNFTLRTMICGQF